MEDNEVASSDAAEKCGLITSAGTWEAGGRSRGWRYCILLNF